MTESAPGGGWWIEEGAQSNEAAWIKGMINHHDCMAEKAVTSRIFGLCCGLNLTEEGTIPDILQSLTRCGWDSLVLPTASLVLPEEFAVMFPELFVQIFYNGITLKSALLWVWATSKRSRTHSNILLMDNLRVDPTVKKLCYGSLSGRPFGVDLPLPWSLCTCARSNASVSWVPKLRKAIFSHNEYLMRYRTTCKHTHLDLAVFTGEAEIRTPAGVQVVIEKFDFHRLTFPLDSQDSVCMRPHSTVEDTNSHGEEHSYPWTAFGQLLANSHRYS
ncbi:hypothetical protein RhiXN_02415 [Rhizoctonia solani]|uniref:Uncharacterized protein n=1 Tax=Rhizoctonia solani TaxID=456999 RepID=A0A8H8NRM7_9AGAM|nr:uncharacterized protein RhiXN_02415 [Rhizoctonia solani]QRW17493.1 hypothetical protein RhiXN_02415 [Rhizoctonia solani]